jgi:hypothetical protein
MALQYFTYDFPQALFCLAGVSQTGRTSHGWIVLKIPTSGNAQFARGIFAKHPQAERTGRMKCPETGGGKVKLSITNQV